MNHVGWYVPASPAELDHSPAWCLAWTRTCRGCTARCPAPTCAITRTPTGCSRPSGAGRPARTRCASWPARRWRRSGGRAPQRLAAAGAVVRARGRAADRRLAARLSPAAHPRTAEPGQAPLAARRRHRRGPRDAAIAAGRAEPLPVVELPDLPRGILARHACYERLAATTLAAGAAGDDDLVRVLLANPMVTQPGPGQWHSRARSRPGWRRPIQRWR